VLEVSEAFVVVVELQTEYAQLDSQVQWETISIKVSAAIRAVLELWYFVAALVSTVVLAVIASNIVPVLVFFAT